MPCRVVVGEPGEQTRADHGGERGETAAPPQPPARFVVPAGPASVKVPHPAPYGARNLQIRPAPQPVAVDYGWPARGRGRTVRT